MRYVVAYDIEPDRIRTRISKLLEGYGDRVQYSVFECLLEPQDVVELSSRLIRELEDEDAGTIRIYRVCEDCSVASSVIGKVPPAAEDTDCIIID
ncbi:MAG: CRISPR-associated endonuclease Cas2 [bacterium]|nr:CRISPR-associated endonuclease Cas2 [bacterium]